MVQPAADRNVGGAQARMPVPPIREVKVLAGAVLAAGTEWGVKAVQFRYARAGAVFWKAEGDRGAGAG
jgi:hypothetical protein